MRISDMVYKTKGSSKNRAAHIIGLSLPLSGSSTRGGSPRTEAILSSGVSQVPQHSTPNQRHSSPQSRGRPRGSGQAETGEGSNLRYQPNLNLSPISVVMLGEIVAAV